jgi:hypothetical protein
MERGSGEKRKKTDPAKSKSRGKGNVRRSSR